MHTRALSRRRCVQEKFLRAWLLVILAFIPLLVAPASGQKLCLQTKLSRNDAQSCASCHDQLKAFSDDRVFSLGESGQQGRRNAMPLMNLAWAKEFFWDGRAKSLREQVLLPILATHEMNKTLERVAKKLKADRDYPARFRAASRRNSGSIRPRAGSLH